MAQSSKTISSNATGIRYAREPADGRVDSNAVWNPITTTEHGETGVNTTTTSLQPISEDRQEEFGALTGIDGQVNFTAALVHGQSEDLIAGYLFTTGRRPVRQYGAISSTGVVSGGGITSANRPPVGALVLIGEEAAPVVVSASSGNQFTIPARRADTAGGTFRVVGHRLSAASNPETDVSGNWPAITVDTGDLTDLALVPGEFVWVGGTATNSFASANFVTGVNAGWARVRSIENQRVEFGKTTGNWTTDSSGSNAVDVYFGNSMKNGGTSTKCSFEFERILGTAPGENDRQAEYVYGCIPNELTVNLPIDGNATLGMGFLGLNGETRTGTQGVKDGTRPDLDRVRGYSAKANLSRVRFAEVVDGNANPGALFDFIDEATITVSNNLSPVPVYGRIENLDVNEGDFNVAASVRALLRGVTAVQTARTNVETSLDMEFVQSRSTGGNQGVSFDMPLVSVSASAIAVARNEPARLPLTTRAVRSPLGHSICISIFPYLPDSATPSV